MSKSLLITCIKNRKIEKSSKLKFFEFFYHSHNIDHFLICRTVRLSRVQIRIKRLIPRRTVGILLPGSMHKKVVYIQNVTLLYYTPLLRKRSIKKLYSEIKAKFIPF